MSKRRLSQKSSIDGKKKEDSDSEFRQDDSAKRAKLVSLSDTTLQDLPSELLESILLKVIVMEVKALKLAKCAWKEKADQVIARLGTVCSQWSSTLATNFFRHELHRTLDGTAQENILLEIVQQSRLEFVGHVLDHATMKDEIFLICRISYEVYFINVYDYNNIAEVKEVIPLPRMAPKSIAACSVSNCVYQLNCNLYKANHVLIKRIARDGEHCVVSTLIGGLYMPDANLCVAENGSLILSRGQSDRCYSIRVYDSNGSLQQRIKAPSQISWLGKIIPKSGGNLVLIGRNNTGQTELTEIDLGGTVIRRYQPSVHVASCRADRYGRVLIADRANRMELLDSEFNPVDVTCPQLGGGNQLIHPFQLDSNSERNELVALLLNQHQVQGVLTIFQSREI